MGLDVGAKPTIVVMTAPHPRRTAAVMGIAAAGLALGHWAAYAIAAPGAHERDAMLHATGHGYLPYATQVALLAGALGLAVSFLARLTNRARRGSVARDAAALAMAQAAAFLAIEIGERLLAGASLHDLTHGPLLTIGLSVQLLVAAGGAAVLRLTDRAAEAAHGVRRLVASPLPPPITVAMPVAASSPSLRPLLRRPGSRGPPLHA